MRRADCRRAVPPFLHSRTSKRRIGSQGFKCSGQPINASSRINSRSLEVLKAAEVTKSNRDILNPKEYYIRAPAKTNPVF